MRVLYGAAIAFSIAYLLMVAVSGVFLRHAEFFHLSTVSRGVAVQIHSALILSPAGGVVLDGLAIFWSATIGALLFLVLLRRKRLLSDLRGPKSPPPAPRLIRSPKVIRDGGDRNTKVLQFRRR
jgi:hypothetical protein